jgi:hypothetical protein
VKPVTLAGFLTVAVLGCQSSETNVITCEGVEGMTSDPPATYRIKGQALVGDVDADRTSDRVTLRVDLKRPPRCRHLLVAALATGDTAVKTVPPLPWPGTDPQLLLLAEIDGRPGVEPVVALNSNAAVYRPGAIFTLRNRTLVRMRIEGLAVPTLVPFYDEFPAGADCAGTPGRIVVTLSRIAERGDRFWDLTRSFYRAAGIRFDLVRKERFLVDVGPEARKRWPEVRGAPFLSCPQLVVPRESG